MGVKFTIDHISTLRNAQRESRDSKKQHQSTEQRRFKLDY